MHPEGAEVLATYESDFYAGMPAVTKNIYGKGHVYYVATQLEAAGLARVLDEATNEVSVSGVIAEETGLEITCRESENTRFYFVMNFTDEKQTLPASLAGMVDTITGEAAKEGDVMNKWDVKILGKHYKRALCIKTYIKLHKKPLHARNGFSSFLIIIFHHTPLLKESDSIAEHLIIILFKLLCIHLILYLL